MLFVEELQDLVLQTEEFICYGELGQRSGR